MSSNRLRNMVMAAGAETLWHIPYAFSAARVLGPSYSLRCVVFHNIAAEESPYTEGIRVSISPQAFEETLRFLTKHYVPISLHDVLASADGKNLPPRPLLVTFDDAYASVVEHAAPLCLRHGVPAVFFINAAFIDNHRLAPDNLVCYVASKMGMEAINAAACSVRKNKELQLHSLAEVFEAFFPSLSLAERELFLQKLRELDGIDERRLAAEAGLYLTTEQVRTLASFNFEIGNHTYTHTHCRQLSTADLVKEIDRNREELEAISGARVRSYSQPYGSSKDLTPELTRHLKCAGYEAAFLSESVANPKGPRSFTFNRVSTCAESDAALFFDIEALPRLRAARNYLLQRNLDPKRS